MKKYVYIPLLLALFVLYGIDAKSGDCSSVNSIITDSINDFEVQIDEYAVGKIAKVNFKYKPATTSSNGIISIDWSTLTDKQEGMTDEALKDFVLNAILRKFGREQDTSDTLTYAVYSSTNCYTTLNCVFKVDTSRNVCCDNYEQNSPVVIWEQNNEKFVSIPVARYICSKQCCIAYFKIWLYNYEVSTSEPLRPSVFITRNREQDEIFSECSQDSVAPHCLLSTDPNSPYYREYDPNPISAPCLGDCP